MKSIISIFLGLVLFTAHTFAAEGNFPPDFNSAKWNSLVVTSLRKGRAYQLDSGILFSLAHIVPNDESKPRVADYFSTLLVNNNGQWVPVESGEVHEVWTVGKDGYWHIDQWVYILSLDGQLADVAHNYVVEGNDGRVYDSGSYPTGGPRDPEILGQWARQLQDWYGWAEENSFRRN